MSVAKRDLEASKSAVNYNSQNIVDAEQVVEGYEDSLRRLERLKAELFEPASKPSVPVFGLPEEEPAKQEEPAPQGPVKKSKAKTEQGKRRAAARGLIVPDQE